MTTPVSATIPRHAVDSQNPWPGLAAFEEADHEFFKGRDEEITALLRLIVREDLTLFWGLSGLGKTSLLRAGLFPRVRQADIFPVYVRLRYEHDEAEAAHSAGSAAVRSSLTEQCFEAIRAAGEQWNYEVPAESASATIWEYVRRRDSRFWGPGDRLATPLLVLDQFEELFTFDRHKGLSTDAIASFFRDLSDAVSGCPPDWLLARGADQSADSEYLFRPGVFKVLLSFREDFLSQVANFTALVPAIDHNYSRLDSMSFAQALSVVADAGGHLIDAPSTEEHQAICNRIVERVAASPTPAAQTSATVDPALLSLFCRELNEQRRARQKPMIDRALVESGEASQIISGFYESCMKQVSDATRRVIEDWLVLGESRTRGSLAQEQALESGALGANIEFLIKKRILRREETTRRGQPRLELTHDVLVEPALVARQRRKLEELRQRQELELAEREERERQERERQRGERESALMREHLELTLELQTQRALVSSRRKKAYILALSVGLLIALVTVFVALLLRREALRLQAEDRERLIEGMVGRAVDESATGRPAYALARIATVLREKPDSVVARSLALDLLLRRAWMLPVASVSAGTEGTAIVEFNSRGNLIATAGGNTAQIWEADTGNRVGALLRHPQRISRARFSDDDRWLATASDDGSVRISSGTTGASLATIPQSAPVTAIAFDPRVTGSESPVLATASGTVAQLWAIGNDGARVLLTLRHGAAVSSVAFSGDGVRLLTASDSTVGIWDAQTGRRLHALRHSSEITVAEFSPDPQVVVTGTADGQLQLWNSGKSVV